MEEPKLFLPLYFKLKEGSESYKPQLEDDTSMLKKGNDYD